MDSPESGNLATSRPEISVVSEIEVSSDPTPSYRFYGELADWWPLVASPADYVEVSDFLLETFRRHEQPVTTVVEFGSGPGNKAVHLARECQMTLVDNSTEMIEISRVQNPSAEHIYGDMKTVRIGRTFHAVLIHSAIDYMRSLWELRQAIATAWDHLRPGGIAVFSTEDVAEEFAPSSTVEGHDDETSGRGIRVLQWTWDPDTTDSSVVTDYTFVMREPTGEIHVGHETHHYGMFKRQQWLSTLADVGFIGEAREMTLDNGRGPRTIFVGIRPIDG